MGKIFRQTKIFGSKSDFRKFCPPKYCPIRYSQPHGLKSLSQDCPLTSSETFGNLFRFPLFACEFQLSQDKILQVNFRDNQLLNQ